jgi:hypothetical protein
MLRDGTVSVDDADRLLRALEAREEGRSPGRARVIRVRISGHRGERVNVALPLALADLVLKLLPRHVRMTVDGRELDLARVVGEIRNGEARGTIVDVHDPSGDHIEVIAE